MFRVLPLYLIYRPANNIPYATLEEDLGRPLQLYCSREWGSAAPETAGGSEVRQKCQTFQHWLYLWTNGSFLVTDLAGRSLGGCGCVCAREREWAEGQSRVPCAPTFPLLCFPGNLVKDIGLTGLVQLCCGIPGSTFQAPVTVKKEFSPKNMTWELMKYPHPKSSQNLPSSPPDLSALDGPPSADSPLSHPSLLAFLPFSSLLISSSSPSSLPLLCPFAPLPSSPPPPPLSLAFITGIILVS